MPVMAGEFLAKLGDAVTLAVTDGASATVALPTNATRGYRATAIDAPQFIQLGESDVVVSSASPQAALAVDESIEFRAQADGQTHIAAMGRGGGGTLLITALDH